MKAIFETGGKQYYVAENDKIYVELLDAEIGSDITFDKVLFINGKAGNPYVKNASVVCSVEKHGKRYGRKFKCMILEKTWTEEKNIPELVQLAFQYGDTIMDKILQFLVWGQILLNGINIKKYNYDEYMKIFSVVFQDYKLLARPLAENVAASCDYDENLVYDSLNKAGFGERLKEFPKGINTFLYKNWDKEGVEVSGGEAQKIAIARALYKDAPFIILDEPTAALDPIAEAEIYSKFNEIVGDKTAIYISHRLSSCKFCDEIMVFDNGNIIEKGGHEELLGNRNKYYELWNAQAQYYV